MKVLRLLHVSLTVRDIGATARFYQEALGFMTSKPPADADPALETILGAGALRITHLQRGDQTLELAMFDNPGAPYPATSASNDLWFQHCALVTEDIGGAYGRLRAQDFTPISRNGPETLAGGVVAFKFRDPEGHPLELIQFPQANAATAGGIDHSAIAVADAERSIAFYTGTLDLTVASRQVNTGPSQDALDGLDGTIVDVVGLAPAQASPHVELLGYGRPRGRAGARMRQNDVAASRLVFAADGDGGRLLHDPDGHAVVLVP